MLASLFDQETEGLLCEDGGVFIAAIDSSVDESPEWVSIRKLRGSEGSREMSKEFSGDLLREESGEFCPLALASALFASFIVVFNVVEDDDGVKKFVSMVD